MKRLPALAAALCAALLALLLCVLAFASIAHGVSGDPQGFLKSVLVNFAANAPLCVLVFFADYKIILKLQPLASRLGRARAVALEWLSATAVICALSFVLAFALKHLVREDVPFTVLPTALCNTLLVLFIELYLYYKRQVQTERRLVEAEKQKALWQFEALKNQVNPHFLFNCLNVLSSLAYADAAKANRFAKELAKVYRYLLQSTEKHTVSLAEEMAFVSSYLYLMKIRLGETLRLSVEDAGGFSSRQVVPASVQLLVENALKHNVSSSERPLEIRIVVGECGVSVENSLQPRRYVASAGVGLSNIARRYEALGREIKRLETPEIFKVELPFAD